MAEKYTTRIERFCQSENILIPSGFYRHPANRYAVVQLTEPAKLVAKTWFTQEDVIHYLKNLSGGASVRILDFKDGVELELSGEMSLKPGRGFLSEP